MNPLSTIPSPAQFDAVQRIDNNRINSPRDGSDDARQEQQVRAEQPASGVQVSLSDTARELASRELSSTQVVQGSNAASQADNNRPGNRVDQAANDQSRPASDSQERRGVLVNEQA